MDPKTIKNRKCIANVLVNDLNFNTYDYYELKTPGGSFFLAKYNDEDPGSDVALNYDKKINFL